MNVLIGKEKDSCVLRIIACEKIELVAGYNLLEIDIFIYFLSGERIHMFRQIESRDRELRREKLDRNENLFSSRNTFLNINNSFEIFSSFKIKHSSDTVLCIFPGFHKIS